MSDHAAQLAAGFLTVDRTLEQEFEVRLAESSTVAFRVAYTVLRQRQGAEDVAQDAFVRAYRNFSRLRDRERFRAWLVRITWRLALDRRRGDRRRAARDTRWTGEAAECPATLSVRSGEGGSPTAVDDLVARE